MSKADDKVLTEAKKRFQRCQEWQSEADANWIDDVKFGYGDSLNGWQWPQAYYKARTVDQRPTLTVNKAKIHCLQIINDARQNKQAVKVSPVSNGATYDAAQVLEGVVRHIEYISNAQDAYSNAVWGQVFGGVGYWRVLTDYADDDTLDQEIYIRRVADPLSVYLDPDIRESDGSDARFAFVFEDMPRDVFEATYPDAPPHEEAIDGGWVKPDTVRVAEYFRRVEKTSSVHMLEDGSRVSDDDLAGMAKKPKVLRSRSTTQYEVEHYKLTGQHILEKAVWPGRYVPIVRVVGEETVIQGRMDRRGHIRGLRDAQQMYNYYTSTAVESIGLQSKTPYLAPIEAIEGYQTYWDTANTTNHAYLPYKHISDDGRTPIPAPTRQQPPVMPSAFMDGLKVAQNELMMASGQYQAVFGEKSNETSGVAIQQRERQGDNATFHYIDRLAQAIRFTGRILVDLIPKIYDTPRVLRILGEDGSEDKVQLDPNSPDAYREHQIQDGVVKVFNPGVGRYDVEADVGPSYGTQRQEAFNAITQILAQNKEAFPIIGDLLFKMGDFPLSDEIAERLQRMVPPQAMGGGQDPQAQQAQAQMQQMQQMIQQLQAQLQQAQQKTETDNYRAETERMKAIGGIDPEAFKPVIRELISQALGSAVVPIMAQHAAAEQAMAPPEPPPMPGGGQQQPSPAGQAG